ncbi:Bug family tripartite tricarboxylate transporter substrate binding protein [Pseudorhodoferax soli]|uniref:Tripartite-type tricarboxylate transporter receptor subunit TctC n=1 Tax=Pseudorhodoferax soli TaxID=545864 RepID=A0A368XKD4_9BURK|nr:tripartite tricarboxylate transporter substrate binding protein [Pseudorhodoferax soli]RCW68491.1 tripartite-type tricarboxylate transporter receptor subunit TctC [Pseudorhodoferax soli]
MKQDQQQTPRRRDIVRAGLAGAFAVAAPFTISPAALAQPAFPSKPMKIIVPFAPGTGSDVIARTFGQKIGEDTGQVVVVENREGGGGIVGTMAAMQAAPDGHTLLMVANPFTIVAATSLKPPYDPLKDFVPVAKVAIVPIVLTIANALNIGTIQELIAYAKANPGKLNYASSGQGTPSQLEMEIFKQAMGLDIVEIPYKSTAQAMTDVIGGQVSMYPSAMPLCLPHVRAGKVKALGVFDSQRSAQLPDVPHLAEALGQPNYVATPLWYGFVTRAGLPKDVGVRLHELAVKAMSSKEVIDRLTPLGAHPISPSNEQFIKEMQAEIDKASKLSKTLGFAK